MKYAKYKTLYRFKDLKNDNEFREKYSNTPVYTFSYTYTFYCWFCDKCDVVLFKRPQLCGDNTLVTSVVIKTDSLKAARVIARTLSQKELKRMFNKCNSIIL